MTDSRGIDAATKSILSHKAAIEHSLKYVPILTESSGCSIDAGFENLDDIRRHLDRIELALYVMWHERGYSWAQIGADRGITKQSAFKRYKRLLSK